eukprot:SAG31_NODE_3709_length_3967_cov_8.847983_2_plen_112_part_00
MVLDVDHATGCAANWCDALGSTVTAGLYVTAALALVSSASPTGFRRRRVRQFDVLSAVLGMSWRGKLAGLAMAALVLISLFQLPLLQWSWLGWALRACAILQVRMDAVSVV